ncbi:aldehyde dehydrogenase family protein [Egicoccus halophilus]|uniref:Benzaldehyde dehydrogenase n=1 Tax=Egicoccus halophilus TaxID=1670830 RepID=A0A8J3ESZ3_9ACTN|nr:aldehyde dehydrogenase family protein [Egicoccus halophilus]GGI08474.1 benzaldehyde dehydrogenase [Egicoccus halophilus]
MPFLDVDRWNSSRHLGRWEPAEGERTAVTDKATGQTLLEIPLATSDHLDTAVERARAAQAEWAARPFQERAEVFATAAALLQEHGDEFRPWFVRECGGTWMKADFEVELVTGELHHAAALLHQPQGHLLPTTQADRRSAVRRVPRGIVGVISPWNFPGELTMRSVAPALALGNAVVLKPATDTPVTGALLWIDLLRAAGLPDDLLHVLPGSGSEIGNAIVEHPDVDMVSFTGSTDVGRKIGEKAGANLIPVALELGGDNAFVVLEDADVEVAASAGAFGTFFHQGHICMAIGRHLVHESIAERYTDLLVEKAEALKVGNAFEDHDVTLGPITNASQLDTIDEIVRDTLDAGARLRTGGERDDPYYRPTVVDRVRPEHRLFREEHFGPVAVVTTFADDDEAVALANDTEYGFVAGIHAGTLTRARAIGDRLDVGMVHLNDQPVNDEAVAPFGGNRASGNGGRFGGFADFDEFTEWQWVTERDTPVAYPM